MHPKVYCSTIYNSQNMEAAYTSINRGVDKEDVVYIYIYIYIHWNITQLQHGMK